MKAVSSKIGFKTNKTAFILGAGFSKCAELPVQSEFSTLLTSNEFQTPIDLLITKVIKDFFVDVFGWKENTEIPTVEDIFTFIDISAGTGHHLGIKYKPNRLRAIRRMLIHRVFQIIDHRFRYSPDIETLLTHFTRNDSSFISMNWDIVLEKHLQAIGLGGKINYITPSFDWGNHERGNSEKGVKICKMHGSSNWAYCENCKTLFYLLEEKLSLHKKVGLIKSDFRFFDESFLDKHFDESIGLDPKERSCRICNNSVATHIATFSYRKSFRTSAYPAIWSEAENILANATKWIFIGYSMPAADFELKHLIKSAQLRFKHKGQKKEIDVVIYKDKITKDTFTKFFGSDNINIFDNGLADYVSKL